MDSIFLYIYFFLKFEKVEKIGYHSNFNFECNTERAFKESLSVALGSEVRDLRDLYLTQWSLSLPHNYKKWAENRVCNQYT